MNRNSQFEKGIYLNCNSQCEKGNFTETGICFGKKTETEMKDNFVAF